MRYDLSGARMRKAWLTAVVLLVGCTSATVPTGSVRPSTATTLSSAAPAATTTSPTPPSTEVATPSAQPEQTPTQGATPSPTSGDSDGLAAIFQTWAPALALFLPGAPVVKSGEQVIADLEVFADIPFVQEEIDRYTENGLIERGSMALGTTPAASITVDRFESEAGAAADFPEREASCDDLVVPGTELVDVVAKRCNAPAANSLYVIAHRGDLVVTVQVQDLPEEESIEPVVATLVEVMRTVLTLTP